MKCILFNKNTKVLSAEFDPANGVFSKVYEVYNIDYAPYILKSYYKENDLNDTLFVSNLSNWFKSRGIPSWRDKLDLLLHRLNVNAPTELLDKAFGLSLSDQYFIKPYDMNVIYDDINFFDNDFEYSEFMSASLSKNSEVITNESSLKTPNNTTDGMLKKAWVIDGGTRYLIKGGYKSELLEPFNEVLASEICRHLGFLYVPYTLEIYKDTVVSKCPCFINKDTELITCHQIMNGITRHNSVLDYEEYLKVLESNGIIDARVKLENMYILDFLIINEDRHLNNFGIIRDVNTLKWLDVAPIFDNGESLRMQYFDEEELHLAYEGRLFYEVKSFDEIIKVVRDLKRLDISKLDGVVEWYDELLHKYQEYTKFSDLRINRLCVILNRQISKLKNLIEEVD